MYKRGIKKIKWTKKPHLFDLNCSIEFVWLNNFEMCSNWLEQISNLKLVILI